ncbi:uncharacterized protein [Physcomitrium patens]|uniref:uncharacterized protein isoform X5 n=1 Tax=Physcomitrium patens TaxID=3218 RepID=UPI003CCD5F2B
MARRCCLWINLSLYLQERGSLPDPCIVSDSQTQAITVFLYVALLSLMDITARRRNVRCS